VLSESVVEEKGNPTSHSERRCWSHTGRSVYHET
jgi:hypothetical protein